MQISQTDSERNAHVVQLRPHSLARVNAQIAALGELLRTEPPSRDAYRRALAHMRWLHDRRRQILDHWRAAG